MRYVMPVLLLIGALAAPAGAQDVTAESSDEEANIAEIEEVMAKVRARVEALDKAAAQRNEALEFLAKQVEQATQSLSSQDEQNSSLQQKNAELDWELESLVETRTELNAELARVTTERDTLVAELQTQVAGLAEMLSLEQQAKANLTEEIAGLSSELRATQGDHEALGQALAEARQAATRDAETITLQKGEIAELERRLNLALASKVEELARYRSEFFGRLRQVLGEHRDIQIVGDRFVFQSEVLFESGSAELGAEGRAQMSRLARTLLDIARDIPPEIDWVLRVDGHTDSRPIHTSLFPSNWELSTARAISVVKFLIAQRLPARRLAATGFGEFQPIDPGEDEIAYRRNRRIELKLTQR